MGRTHLPLANVIFGRVCKQPDIVLDGHPNFKIGRSAINRVGHNDPQVPGLHSDRRDMVGDRVARISRKSAVEPHVTCCWPIRRNGPVFALKTVDGELFIATEANGRKVHGAPVELVVSIVRIYHRCIEGSYTMDLPLQPDSAVA